MSLIDAMMTNCIMMNKTRIPDGEGGFVTTWVDGAEFNAAITLDTTMQARVAEQQGVSNVYTVTTYPSATLDYHDVFKRVTDGKTFRVTSNGADKTAPSVATKVANITQVTAEAWDLT